MRVGVTLPQFRSDPEPALQVAGQAEALGLDGVFVFDHMWPLGRPDRPALHGPTLLGALTAETYRVVLGTLVARVAVCPDDVLVTMLVTLSRMAGGRFIAGLGTGDSRNRDENEAYGVPFPDAAERVARLTDCCEQLTSAGVRTWIGGRSQMVQRAAAAAGGWNGWGADAATFAGEAASVRQAAQQAAQSTDPEVAREPGGTTAPEVTWGGQVLIGRNEAEAEAKFKRYGDRPGLVRGTVEDLRRHFRALAEAGATWAVCAPLDIGHDASALETLVLAARRGN